jgi:CO/xanthine dehydrogenase FAD-binding subunit
VSLAHDGEVRVAVGGCALAAIPEADRILSSDTSPTAATRAGDLLASLADPVDDVRGTAEYRSSDPTHLARAQRRCSYLEGRGEAGALSL